MRYKNTRNIMSNLTVICRKPYTAECGGSGMPSLHKDAPNQVWEDWKVSLNDADVLIKMVEKARKRGIEFMDKTDVVDLLVSDGKLVGATAFSMLDGTPYVLKAKAVIMANGNQNWGIMKMWSSGRGEGIATAYRAGGKMRNAEFGSFGNIVSKDHGHVSL
jgi:glycerol-3-phosphate dehydrogenase